MSELTPMKKQYREIKEKYQDCLLFFRLGDFYEMFDEDALIASKQLNLTLTTRDRAEKDPEKRTPMCGVPFHSAPAYISKLVEAGHKVAICEQAVIPNAPKGLYSRKVIRVVSPGLITDASMLPEGKSNYIGAVYMDECSAAVAFCDISTGEFCTAAFSEEHVSHIMNELGRFRPREVIMNRGAFNMGDIPEFIVKKLGSTVEVGGDDYEYMPCAALVCEQFSLGSVDEAGLGEKPAAVSASGALLRYIREMEKAEMSHIRSLDVFNTGRFMEMDWETARSLELTESLRTGEKKGSLLWVLDKTRTPMGGRLLRQWVERPLLSPVAIRRRLSAVDELFHSNVTRAELTEQLRGITDMQRIIGRISYGTANGRDLLALGACLHNLPEIARLMKEFKCAALTEIAGLDTLPVLCTVIEKAICDDPPFSVREGGIFREGYYETLDSLRNIRDNGAEEVAKLEAYERERTGIKKLKVGYNKVFGYFIDVPKSFADKVPDDYIRKQTLVGNERYFTQELKNLETTLVTAADRVKELEYQLFTELCRKLAERVAELQAVSDAVARLDVFCSLAEVAVRNGYCMPEVDGSGELIIKQGRHPVVEKTLSEVAFVPNDTELNTELNRVALVTGPNMAGKSTYMRQTALITLMAQMGSFVPAKSAVIGIVDRVFTRIGASDDLASGQSTFMLEMSETANILRFATKRSLLILDEIGRGTSTYDGMAIARAVLEYCADKKRLGAKTMFATHYHELSALEGSIEGLRNYSISAKKKDGTLVFLRKIVPGAADDSFGIEVAKLAGIPDAVITKAKTYLRELESAGAAPKQSEKKADDPQVSFTDVGAEEAARRLRSVDVDSLRPIDALNILSELCELIRG